MLTGLPPTPIETARYVPMAKGVEVIEYAIPSVLQSLNGFVSGETRPVLTSMSASGGGTSSIFEVFVTPDMVAADLRRTEMREVRFCGGRSLLAVGIEPCLFPPLNTAGLRSGNEGQDPPTPPP